MSSFHVNPRLATAALAMLVVLPGAMCSTSSSDPASMDKRTLFETVVKNGAFEALRAPGAGEVVETVAALPEVTKGYLILHLTRSRDEAIAKGLYSTGQEQAEYDARADWYDANLRCINEGNCDTLRKLQQQRKAAELLGTGDEEGGHSD